MCYFGSVLFCHGVTCHISRLKSYHRRVFILFCLTLGPILVVERIDNVLFLVFKLASDTRSWDMIVRALNGM